MKRDKTLAYYCVFCGCDVAAFPAERNTLVGSVCDKPECRKQAHDRYMLGLTVPTANGGE